MVDQVEAPYYAQQYEMSQVCIRGVGTVVRLQVGHMAPGRVFLAFQRCRGPGPTVCTLSRHNRSSSPPTVATSS